MDEGLDAEVVGPDPDGVDGGVGRVGHEFRAVGVGVGAVGQVGGDFVLRDGGEGGVDGGVEARGDGVAADGAADGVVVEVDAGVLFYVLGPDAAAG